MKNLEIGKSYTLDGFSSIHTVKSITDDSVLFDVLFDGTELHRDKEIDIENLVDADIVSIDELTEIELLVLADRAASRNTDDDVRIFIMGIFLDRGFLTAYGVEYETREEMITNSVWNYKTPLGNAVASAHDLTLDLP